MKVNGNMTVDFPNVDLKTTVQNVPKYAWTLPVWVVRYCDDNQFWFFGAWERDEAEKAVKAANEINGIVIVGN